MAQRFKVALVQNCAGADIDANIAECSDLVRQAHGQGADLICLPEMFSCLHSGGGTLDVGPHPQDNHPALEHFSRLAAELGAWIQPGSVAVEMPTKKLRNRAVMLDPTGAVVAQYDKAHMFDVDLADGESYRESEVFESGDEIVLAPTPWGLVGMTVCYDLRFAYLYRSLAQAGARYLTVPAAFMRTTGKAHWHVLLRSRAIETGCYVFAACQWGTHGDAVTYGHSLVVAPWGEVIADGGETGGVVIAEVDSARVDEARVMVPALRHDRQLRPPKPASVGRASG
jgi:predicted amidohydrolase